MTRRRRRWVLAPVAERPERPGPMLRSTSPTDDHLVAELLDRTYVGTIDHDPDANHVGELETWRAVDGADDQASALAPEGDQLIGACLIGRELGAPLLYEIAVLGSHRRRGVGRLLLDHSLTVLAARREPHVAAWVTDGNAASEALLSNAGFVSVTPPVVAADALGYYRAAGAIGAVEAVPDAPLAVTLDDEGPTLWILDGDDPPAVVTVRNVDVQVRHVSPTSPRVCELASRAMPLRNAAWLLDQRSTT